MSVDILKYRSDVTGCEKLPDLFFRFQEGKDYKFAEKKEQFFFLASAHK